jgi:hypothetical protein
LARRLYDSPYRVDSSSAEEPVLHRTLLTLGIVLSVAASSASGEERAPLEREAIRSMGQPQTWKPHVGVQFDKDRDGTSKDGGEILVGVYHDLLNPMYGAFGIVGEAYFRMIQGRSEPGFRLLGAVPVFGLQAGSEYDARDNEWDFLMSLQVPVRRGGPFGLGGRVRFDWYPGKDGSYNLGYVLPLGKPWIGKTRPRVDHVRLPGRPAPVPYVVRADLQEVMDRIRHAADWINRFTTPFFDQDGKTDEEHMSEFLAKVRALKKHIHTVDALYPDGHTFEREILVYHREIERAFALASGADAEGARRIAQQARDALLDGVILPYNRLLGQRKARDSLIGLGDRAEQAFMENVADRVGKGAREGVRYVFRTLVSNADRNRAGSLRVWGDSRLVWIPLHYALRPGEHDTQSELDALLERALGVSFTDANDVHYVVNELFQPELARSIGNAEDYHVLWIHDYRGLNTAGQPDRVAYRMTVEAYLRALTERVRRFDATGKLPVYMVFLDQFFYEVNDGRLWMTLLENPLDHELDLPEGFEEWETTVRAAQEDLRAAVAGSKLLTAGQERYGERWLENRVKVHVNITNPSDFSYRSARMIEYVPLVPDNLLRDHRKIAFYDVTELDPGKGEAIYTGMGVGEHYSGPTWDDRAMLARGPALLTLKDAARELLLSQGFDEAEIPEPLRAIARPPNYDEMLAGLQDRGWNDSALEVHNATGYGPKPANLVKAVLYDAMPSGSRMYVPDSLWNSPFWGGMLVGSALQGCRVYVIAPALENAPSADFPQMSRANEVFVRFVVIQSQLSPEIEAAGGAFRTGIYARDIDVGDIPGKARAFSAGVDQVDFFRDEFPFAPSVYETIARTEQLLREEGFEATYLTEDVEKRKPKLHLKTQFFASDPAISTLVPLPAWEPLVRDYLIARAEQTRARERHVDAKELRAALTENVGPLVESWDERSSAHERDRAMFYLVIGSHNQDYRGKIMDGEVLFVVSQDAAMLAYFDFVYLMGLTTWVETVDQVNALLPPHSGVRRWIGRHLRNAL